MKDIVIWKVSALYIFCLIIIIVCVCVFVLLLFKKNQMQFCLIYCYLTNETKNLTN